MKQRCESVHQVLVQAPGALPRFFLVVSLLSHLDVTMSVGLSYNCQVVSCILKLFLSSVHSVSTGSIVNVGVEPTTNLSILAEELLNDVV